MAGLRGLAVKLGLPANRRRCHAALFFYVVVLLAVAAVAGLSRRSLRPRSDDAGGRENAFVNRGANLSSPAASYAEAPLAASAPPCEKRSPCSRFIVYCNYGRHSNQMVQLASMAAVAKYLNRTLVLAPVKYLDDISITTYLDEAAINRELPRRDARGSGGCGATWIEADEFAESFAPCVRREDVRLAQAPTTEASPAPWQAHGPCQHVSTALRVDSVRAAAFGNPPLVTAPYDDDGAVLVFDGRSAFTAQSDPVFKPYRVPFALPFSPTIRTQAARMLSAVFPAAAAGRDGCAHLRFGDFSNRHGVSMASLANHTQMIALSRWIAAHQLTSLYVATDASDTLLSTFLPLVQRVVPHLHTRSTLCGNASSASLLSAADRTSFCQGTGGDAELRVLALEQTLCTLTTFFIGGGYSTFSHRIWSLRKRRVLEDEHIAFWTKANQTQPACAVLGRCPLYLEVEGIQTPP